MSLLSKKDVRKCWANWGSISVDVGEKYKKIND